MVIDDFNIIGIALSPDEADAPWVVNADAVLTDTIVFEGFQHSARRQGQGFKPGCRIHLQEFSERDPLRVGTEPLGGAPLEHVLGMAVAKALDHG